jgi:hypothetical protein
MRLVLIGFVAAIVLGGGRAKGDFTFGEPTNLGPMVNGNTYEEKPCISADGLSLYFSSDRPGGYDEAMEDIWVCSRPTKDDPWGPAENLGPLVNTELGEYHSTITDDELELYFERFDYGTGTTWFVFDIWVTKRTDKDSAWGQPVKLDLSVPDGFMAGSPSISGDGLELYFGAYHFGDEPQSQLYVVKRETRDAPWGEPASLGPMVNSWSCQAMPTLSHDGLLLLFNDWFVGPSRPDGFGNEDIWFTQRATKDGSWSESVNLGSLINTKGIERCGSPSANGSTLYFSSSRPGGQGAWDIWQAPILPIVDFDRDGSVGLSDLMVMVESWGTDDPQCDIGPMPWGDGVVGEADLEVLMDHWGQEVNYLYDPRQASRPTPSDQSISDVEQALLLHWVLGRYATGHDVYVGMDPVAVEEADISDTTGVYRGRQEANEYTLPEILLPGQTFYWRIDELSTETTFIKGQVWSFSVADYLIVDDMEASDAVWQRWWDGYVDPNNGSFIDDEFTIVHTGEKAMYLFYDNSEAPISQVDRFWEIPQDWTRKGVDTLILWLHGGPDNTAEALQIRLTDSAGNADVITHPDPAVLLLDNWQQWSIPLADVTNIDLTAIQNIAIVIGDNTTEEGGIGELYIDDICLYPVSR